MIRRVHAFAAATLAIACGKAPADNAAKDSPAAKAAGAVVEYAPAAKVRKSALTSMPWLLGKVRGVGAEGTTQEPFYERYSLANDSTLVVEGFADATWSKPDSTRFEIRGDSLLGAKYAASIVTADSVVFSPRAGAQNAFTWRKGDDRSWFAVITPVPAARGTVRTYRMVRVE